MVPFLPLQTMVEPMLDWPDFWETSEEMGM